MSYDHNIEAARAELESARRLITSELSAYPTPISGCDAQFNHLVGLRASVSQALQLLSGPRFVATPRTPHPESGIESR